MNQTHQIFEMLSCVAAGEVKQLAKPHTRGLFIFLHIRGNALHRIRHVCLLLLVHTPCRAYSRLFRIAFWQPQKLSATRSV